MIDNYDSFTYNLVHYFESENFKVSTKRLGDLQLSDCENFERIVISPGPGLPGEKPILSEIIRTFHNSKKILGICLGHQAIAESFGGKLKNMNEVHHGIALPTFVVAKDKIFEGIQKEFLSARYHSWVVERESLPDCLQIIAEDNRKQIMSIKHRQSHLYGIQFHPESILTPTGRIIIRNWLSI